MHTNRPDTMQLNIFGVYLDEFLLTVESRCVKKSKKIFASQVYNVPLLVFKYIVVFNKQMRLILIINNRKSNAVLRARLFYLSPKPSRKSQTDKRKHSDHSKSVRTVLYHVMTLAL